MMGLFTKCACTQVLHSFNSIQVQWGDSCRQIDRERIEREREREKER